MVDFVLQGDIRDPPRNGVDPEPCWASLPLVIWMEPKCLSTGSLRRPAAEKLLSLGPNPELRGIESCFQVKNNL